MHPFDGPDPEARKPKAGASKGTPQRCSLQFTRSRRPRIALGGPFGTPRDEVPGDIGTCYSEGHRRPTTPTEAKAAWRPPRSSSLRCGRRRPYRRRTRSRVTSSIHLSAADNGCCGQPFRYAISGFESRQLSRWPQDEPMP